MNLKDFDTTEGFLKFITYFPLDEDAKNKYRNQLPEQEGNLPHNLYWRRFMPVFATSPKQAIIAIRRRQKRNTDDQFLIDYQKKCSKLLDMRLILNT
jgi:hypothetical protein